MNNIPLYYYDWRDVLHNEDKEFCKNQGGDAESVFSHPSLSLSATKSLPPQKYVQNLSLSPPSKKPPLHIGICWRWITYCTLPLVVMLGHVGIAILHNGIVGIRYKSFCVSWKSFFYLLPCTCMWLTIESHAHTCPCILCNIVLKIYGSVLCCNIS